MRKKYLFLFSLIFTLGSFAQGDDPCTALDVVAESFCNFNTYSNAGFTDSGLGDPGCASYNGADAWFSVTVPVGSGGNLTFECGAGDITDGGMAIYSGIDCNNLTFIECNDDEGTGMMSMIEATGLTEGETIWVRHWEYGGGTGGTFDLCIHYPGPCSNGVQDNGETGIDCGGICPPCVDYPIDGADANTCDGIFGDAGGNNNYLPSQNEEITICPDVAGQAINVNFTTFSVEQWGDQIWIHNGNSVASPLIVGLGGSVDDSYNGTELAGETVTSTSGDGCLTFVWESDNWTEGIGWIGDIFCTEGCQSAAITSTANGNPIVGNIAACVTEPIDFIPTVTFPNNDINYHQDIANCTFLWDFGNGTTSTDMNANATYNTQGTYTVVLTVTDGNNCPNVVSYTVDVTCGGICPPCNDIYPSDPDVSTCVGTFWDSGGNNNYASGENEEITICPNGPAQAINVFFIAFNTEEWSDYMWIHNGNSIASPLITGLGGSLDDSYDGTDLAGETVTSTSGDGCLTFVWESNMFMESSGWIGDVYCTDGCQSVAVTTTANTISIVDNFTSCIDEQIDFVPTVTFPNNDINYHQDIANCTVLWDFGNGTTSTDLNASVIYSLQGTYVVSLTITDGNNCPNIVSYTVDVICGQSCPPCTDIFPSDPDLITCVGTLWDSGFNNPYSELENDTITICSDNGGALQVHFNEFELDSWDEHKFIIYDGPDVTSSLLGMYTTSNPPPIDINSSGTCLTFIFISDEWGVPGAGWSADISCLAPCQEMDVNVMSSINASTNGVIYTCPGVGVDFSADVAFPNNDIGYHQDITTTSISWSAFNGATGSGYTFFLPADSAFNTEVFIDVEDINGCHYYDTISVVSECQVVDVLINTDAGIMQSGEIFLLDTITPLSLDGIYSFPENGDCYTQTLGELTWTFGITDLTNGDLIESHTEDTVILFPSTGVYDVILTVEDQEGCFEETSVEVHVGCQPIDVTWTGTPTMLGDTIIVCPGEAFNIEIFTDYFANNSPYYQEDANMIFNWNMGDGTLIGNQMNPGAYTYTEAGLYNVYLQIVDTNSGADIPCPDNTYIPVYAFMEPSLAGNLMSTDTICFGDSLILYGNTTLDMPEYLAPPLFLPDGDGTSYTSVLTFDMFGDEILTDVNDFISICMNLEHSYMGDLEILLECPNGQFVELLLYPNDGSSNHLGEPCDFDPTSTTIGVGYEYCFTPNASTNWNENVGLFTHDFVDNDGNSITNSYIPPGDYAPVGTFDDLLGCPLNGDWEIQITDNLLSDDGMIFDWGITFDLDGLIPPDTIQFPLEMREWTVETGGDAIINTFNEDDAYVTPQDIGDYTFTFTITSPAGCSYDTTIGPLYVAPVPIWTLGNDTSLCDSYDYTIPGTLTGGDGTWSYTGPGLATFSNINSIPVDVTVDTYGDYVFYFTPNTIAICSDPDSILVSFHEQPTVDAVIDSLTCYQLCDGEVTVTPTGIELPYYYNWSNSDETSHADSLCSGNYTLTVATDYCSNNYSYLVPQPSELEIVNSGRVDNLCYQDNAGQAWISVEGGSPGYSYTWDPANNGDSLIIDLPDGPYQVTVTDDNGCQKSTLITVHGPIAPLTITEIEPIHVTCYGQSNGVLDLKAEGGTLPYLFDWVSGNSFITSDEDPTGLVAGTYNVTVTDANDCVATGSQTILEPSELLVETFMEPTSCFGYSDGKAWSIASEGTGPYQYEWSTGWADSVMINASAMSYTVTITDSRGCTVSKAIEVEEPLPVVISIVSTPKLCIGESTDLIMSVTSSPFSPYNYYWNGMLSTETITVSPQGTTVYTAQAIDSHGCESNIVEQEVEVFDPIATNFSLDKTEICAGELVTVTLEPEGGNGNYNYITMDGVIVNETFTIQPEQSQTYNIIIGDGCTVKPDTIEFNINVWGTDVPSFHADYKYGCSPLTVNFHQDVQSHDEGTTYLWHFGDESSSLISFDPSPSHIFKTSGSYHISLEITSPEGCRAEKVEYDYIYVYPVPTASFTATPPVVSILKPNIYFENNSVGASFCQWDFGDGDSTIAYHVEHTYPMYSNEYSVQLVAFSNFGCTDSITGLVRIVDEVTFYIPTAFTPDRDGKNEVFRPYGNALSEDKYSMIIYDRWGEIIFESTEINKAWDGKVKNGDIAKLGIYAYLIRFVDTFGISHEKSGYVNLIR